MADDTALPDLDEIEAAARRIAPFVHRTPVVRSRSLDAWSGATVWCKCEHLQRAGAFKFRGATNAVQSLPADQAARGVAAHSSGNHAGALALAARTRGIPAHLVMPADAPASKRRATEDFGAQVTTCEPTLEAREQTLAEVVARTGAIEVHPYDDRRVIAGAGTAALELLTEVPELEVVLTPVGGGGLLSGTSIAGAALRPDVAVFGAEPTGADDAYRSFHGAELVPSVEPRTIADGLRTSLSPRTLRALRAHVTDIVRVDDDATVAAMRLVWERTKMIIEPSSAVAVAALGDPRFRGRRVGVVLTGGNLDLDRLPFTTP